jgi:hypothetical protein
MARVISTIRIFLSADTIVSSRQMTFSTIFTVDCVGVNSVSAPERWERDQLGQKSLLYESNILLPEVQIIILADKISIPYLRGYVQFFRPVLYKLGRVDKSSIPI